MIAADKIRFVDVDGIRTRYYDDGGEGDPVVLIHGAHFGFVIPVGIEQWDDNLEPLAGSGRIIAFDKLGQGYTDAPAHDEAWTYESLATHAIRFLETLELRDIHLVGHSRGGLLALHIAVARPDLVKRLVVVSSASAAPDPASGVASSPPPTFDAEPLAPEAAVAMLATAQATDRALPPGFAQFVRDVVVLPKYADEVRALARVDGRYWAPSLAAARTHVLDHLATSGLGIPTLVIWGMNDRSAPIGLAYAFYDILAQKTPDSTLLVLNNAAHNIFIDQPDDFNSAVRDFVTR